MKASSWRALGMRLAFLLFTAALAGGCSTAGLWTAGGIGAGVAGGSYWANNSFWLSDLLNLGTHLDHTEYFAVRSDDGSTNYFRTVVEIDSTNGEMQLRAGWYDRQAFDALGTVIGFDDNGLTLPDDFDTDPTVDEQIREIKRQLMELHQAVMNAYASAATPLQERERLARELRTSLDGLYQTGNIRIPGETDLDTIDHIDKRFVFVISADPTQFDQAVATIINSRSATEAMNTIINAATGNAVNQAETEQSQSANRLAELVAIINGIQTTETPSPSDLKLRVGAAIRAEEALR